MVKKLKLALWKDAFKETVAELEGWQKLYEPSWFAYIKLAPPAVDILLNIAV